MLNGRILKPLVLALSVACLGGCDSNAMSAGGGSTAQNALPEARHQIVDGGRGRIWTLTHEGLFLRHVASVERRAIELPGWMMAGQPYGHGPALALAPGGDVLVTSDVIPVVWRVDPRTFAVSVHSLALDADHDKDVGFTSIAYSPAHAAYYAVSGNYGTVWKIDTSLSRAKKVATKTTLYSPGG